VKLAAHLAQATCEGTLFIFDEPTTGLHFDDITKLLDAFQRLIASGGSVAGNVLATLFGALGSLGMISKIDRVVQLLGMVAAKPPAPPTS